MGIDGNILLKVYFGERVLKMFLSLDLMAFYVVGACKCVCWIYLEYKPGAHLGHNGME